MNKLIFSSLILYLIAFSSFCQNDEVETVNPENGKMLEKDMPVFFVKSDGGTYRLTPPSQKVLESMDAQEIKKIDVFKGQEAIDKFGHLGENGVVVINMKSGVIINLPEQFLYTINIAQFALKQVDQDYYAWITSLNESPINWLKKSENDIRGRAYRICITTSEIYNSLYIEEVTFGSEGCCKKILSKKELDLYELFKEYQIRGEVTNVKFLKWIDATTCQLTIKDKIYSVSNLDSDIVKVELLE
jgi:hypothetical protein